MSHVATLKIDDINPAAWFDFVLTQVVIERQTREGLASRGLDSLTTAYFPEKSSPRR